MKYYKGNIMKNSGDMFLSLYWSLLFQTMRLNNESLVTLDYQELPKLVSKLKSTISTWIIDHTDIEMLSEHNISYKDYINKHFNITVVDFCENEWSDTSIEMSLHQNNNGKEKTNNILKAHMLIVDAYAALSGFKVTIYKSIHHKMFQPISSVNSTEDASQVHLVHDIDTGLIHQLNDPIMYVKKKTIIYKNIVLK
jgi:hypothetical protein